MPLERGLELCDLYKRYGQTVALDGLSLGVRPGQMHGFVGPNGSGKTTAMRIAIGVLEADSGTVLWDGVPPGAAERRSIGYMPEQRGLYPKMRIAEQLTYLAELHGRGRAAARQSAESWLERLGLAERSGDRLEELSLGNQQRVQLAASLVFEPELLILDEPFSGLDPIGVDVLSEVLLEVCATRGVPVLFSSHQLDLVERLCQEVTIINGGRLIASGEVEELRRSRSENLWRLRVGGAPEPPPGLPQGVEPLGDGLYRLDDGLGPQALVSAALEAGQLLELGPVEPSLAELFRESVSAEEASAGQGA